MKNYRILVVFISLLVAACANQRPYKSTIERPDNIIEIHKELLNEAYSKGVESNEIVSAESLRKNHGFLMPIIKVAPTYPKEALENNIEGWVTCIYTINTLGEPVNISVLENSGTNVFNETAIKAISKFIYKPIVINGKIVSVSGVTHKFTMELAN